MMTARIGVDVARPPDPRMAGVARAAGIEVEIATFETWEPAGRTFDAVVAGTAWPWVDPVAGAAKAALVLRPGGVLAPFGHVYELLDLVATSGGLTSLAPDAVEQVLASVAAAADELGEPLTVPYTTWGLTAIRTDG